MATIRAYRITEKGKWKMSLGLQTESGGDFAPFVKFDARAGRWFRKGTEAEGREKSIDITDGFSAVFDLAGIEVGYLLFASGAAPLSVVQPVAKGLPAKPPGDYKQGFKVMVALPANLGGGVYELAATSKAVISVVDTMHSQYSAAPEAATGKLPVYRMTGTTILETNSPKGTTRNYAPKMELAAWVDRPASMAVKAAAPPAQPPAQQAAVTAQPAATGSTQVAPPPAAKAAATADMAFG